MNTKEFFKRWAEGTKEYAKSGAGTLQAQLIITCFIVVGLFLGAWERKMNDDGIIAFILFAFGCLQVLGIKGLWKAYSMAAKQQALILKAKNSSGGKIKW